MQRPWSHPTDGAEQAQRSRQTAGRQVIPTPPSRSKRIHELDVDAHSGFTHNRPAIQPMNKATMGDRTGPRTPAPDSIHASPNGLSTVNRRCERRNPVLVEGGEPLSATDEEVPDHTACIVARQLSDRPRGGAGLNIKAAFAHHPGPVLPDLTVGADHRFEKGRLALHEEPKARQSIEKLAKQNPAPNPWAVVILEQEEQVIPD